MKEFNKSKVYCIGDTHGLYFWSAIAFSEIRDCVLIHVGDIGLGFVNKKTEEADYQRDRTTLMRMDNLLANRNITLIGIRGNHDDPSYFKPNHEFASIFQNIHLLDDFTYVMINGKKFLFAGGAISIDRMFRLIEMEKKPFITYWPDEGFILPENYETLDKCDVLITHSAPWGMFPNDGFQNIRGFLTMDKPLEAQLIKEREDLLTLFHQVEPKHLCYGHFHNSNEEEFHGCHVTCLNIDEIKELKL